MKSVVGTKTTNGDTAPEADFGNDTATDEDCVVVVGEHEHEHIAYDEDPEGCAALLRDLEAVWKECFAESRRVEQREKYLEHLGWSWAGRKLVKYHKPNNTHTPAYTMHRPPLLYATHIHT